MILVRIREGDKLDKIMVQILMPGVKSGSAVTAPSHTARRMTLHEAALGRSGMADGAYRASAWRWTPPGAEELGREWDSRWAIQDGSLSSLAGPARRVLAQHRFGIKKTSF
jgi:hypothetical protein